MDKIIEDDELGRLVIRVNSRARSLVFRTKSDAVYVSVPPGTTLKEVKQAIENFLVQAMRIALFECENKLQSGQMGELFGSKSY